MTEQNTNTNPGPQLTNEEIEKALATARKKKEALENKIKLTPEERAARKLEDEQAKEARKVERAAATAKKKETEASAAPAHMAKVLKARASLPELLDGAKIVYESIIGSLDTLGISTLVQHLSQYIRETQTINALDVELTEGQMVRILRGSKNAGKLAQVTKAARVRCYVKVVGHDKDEYLFTSDVVPVAVLTADEIAPTEEQVEETPESKVA